MDIKTLYGIAKKTLDSRKSLLSRWQEIADQFYPERGVFTLVREPSDEFADHLSTSFPVICRRELGDAFASMMRQGDWFFPRTLDPDIDKNTEARQFLDQRIAPLMRRAMSQRQSGFSRSTTEVDHDIAAFGQGVISVESNKSRNGLLYRAWHLRDVAWLHDESREINAIFHKIQMTCSEIVKRWPKVERQDIHDFAYKEPGKLFEIHRYVVANDPYDIDGTQRFPYASIYVEPSKCQALESVGSPDMIYAIPRWKLLCDSQYAFSPAVMIALPDARMIQEMSTILLESGQKAIDPAIIVSRNVFREDFEFEPGGITMADLEADQDIRKAFTEVESSQQGIGQWMNQVAAVRSDLEVVMYRNLLRMPTLGPERTAYEVQEIVADHLRRSLPLFQPIEDEWNFRLCDMTLSRIMQLGGIPTRDIPPILQGQDIRFEFTGPVSELKETKKVQIYMQAQQIITAAAAIKPELVEIMDWSDATREALLAGQVPADWLNSAEEIEAARAAQQQAVEAQQMLAQIQQGASAAKDMSQAAATMPTAEGMM